MTCDCGGENNGGGPAIDLDDFITAFPGRNRRGSIIQELEEFTSRKEISSSGGGAPPPLPPFPHTDQEF